MEVFIEEMVKRSKSSKDYLQLVGIVVLTAIIVFIMVGFLMPIFAAFGSIIFLLAAGVVYGAYYLITSSNQEFECSLVNTEMDIDKIINKTRRKRLTTASIRGLEAFGTKNNPDYESYLNNSVVNKIYACRDENADDVFFIVYNQSNKKMMLIFNPSERIIEQIVKRNPQKQML